MKRPSVNVVVQNDAGEVLHSEVKASLNSGVRASEAYLRQLARSEGKLYRGAKPSRVGDVYTREWSSGAKRVTAIITVRPA